MKPILSDWDYDHAENRQNMNLGTLFQSLTLISAILSILLILLQQRGASLGAGFGSSGELYTTRRGLERSLFNATIV